MNAIRFNHPDPRQARRRRLARRARSGFSFTEILFAVMILGLGFIMVAALFPVSIHQASIAGEQTLGAVTSRAGASVVQRYAIHESLPPTNNTVQPLPAPAMHHLLAGNQLVPADTRAGWIVLYRRAGVVPTASPWAQIYVIPVRSRIRSAFDPEVDVTVRSTQFVPTPVTVTVRVPDPNYPGRIQLSGSSAQAAGEGAYVIISAGATAGRIYRLGNTIAPQQEYEVSPEGDSAVAASSVQAFIIGRGLQNPEAPFNASNNPYSGTPRDVAAFSTWIRVN